MKEVHLLLTGKANEICDTISEEYKTRGYERRGKRKIVSLLVLDYLQDHYNSLDESQQFLTLLRIHTHARVILYLENEITGIKCHPVLNGDAHDFLKKIVTFRKTAIPPNKGHVVNAIIHDFVSVAQSKKENLIETYIKKHFNGNQ